MQNEVIRLHHELGKTMVFITHDLAEALKLGDRILIMRDGEIVQIGTPDEVVGAPADDYVRDFTSEVPTLARAHPEVGDARAATPTTRPRARSCRSDTIVREAAQAALASAHPVRVVDDGQLVGIVDDDAILRVVVAEEEATDMSADALARPGGRGAGARRRAPGRRGAARAPTLGLGARRHRRLGRRLVAAPRARTRMALPASRHTDVHD